MYKAEWLISICGMAVMMEFVRKIKTAWCLVKRRNKTVTMKCGWLAVVVVAALTGQVQATGSTAAANVTVLEQRFEMPGLERSRTVRLYLPADYQASNEHYPVLYMHDAQNLFDARTSYAGEWQVDEQLNLLAQQGLKLIVVGIDNGGEFRNQELLPFSGPPIGEAQGDQYLQFIVTVVKPYIDQHYRTKADAAHTGIMGSSMGGLISHYALLKYPDVFGLYGLFSPAYWTVGPQIQRFSSQLPAPGQRLYFYMGLQEGGSMVPDIEQVVRQLARKGMTAQQAQYRLVEGADHNEAAWAAEFSRAVLWLYQGKVLP